MMMFSHEIMDVTTIATTLVSLATPYVLLLSFLCPVNPGIDTCTTSDSFLKAGQVSSIVSR